LESSGTDFSAVEEEVDFPWLTHKAGKSSASQAIGKGTAVISAIPKAAEAVVTKFALWHTGGIGELPKGKGAGLGTGRTGRLVGVVGRKMFGV